MIKEQAIAKINKMGKAGRVITNILKVFTIIGIVILTMLMLLLALLLPKDLFQYHFLNQARLELSIDALKKLPLSQEDLEALERGEIQEVLSQNTYDGMYFTEIRREGDKIVTFLVSGEEDGVATVNHLLFIMLCGTVAGVFTLITLIYAGKLCKSFETCASPFEENVIRRMRRFTYSLIPWVLLTRMSESALGSLFEGKMELKLSVNISSLIIVLALLALVYIFQYGAVLQQESDETL